MNTSDTGERIAELEAENASLREQLDELQDALTLREQRDELLDELILREQRQPLKEQMDQETILQWAREEGMLLPSGPYFAEYEARTLSFAQRIARRAAEAERQACEKECFKLIEISARNAVDGDYFEAGREAGHSECIDAILARITKEQT